MSKIILTKKTSAIFLATVLVAGMIVISSPFSAYAQQQYQQDYESAYYPSDPRMDDKSHSAKPGQKANCDNENLNVNDLSQVQRQEQAIGNNVDDAAVDEATLDSQQLTPEEAFAAINGNGDPLINAERNIVNICINSNDNTLTGTFTAEQNPPQTCVECFESFFTEAEIIALETGFGDTLEESCDLAADVGVFESDFENRVEEILGPIEEERFNNLVECLIEAGIVIFPGTAPPPNG